MVFQSYALWPHLNVARNIAFGLEERRVPKPEIRRRVGEALEKVRLGGYGERSIDQMSGGEQQRVSLARALVVKPRCLLLDEPLSNLDAQLRVEMRREIRAIVKDNRLTAIYVTHDQQEALAMADRLAVLGAGRVSQVGTPEEIYRDPRSVQVAGFIGETNILTGELLEVRGRQASVATAAGRLAGRLSDAAWSPRAGERVALSIRPEAWQLHQNSGDNRVSGTLVERTYLGQRIQYWVETAAGRQQVVEINPQRLLAPGGEALVLHVREDDVVVLKI